MWLYRRSMSLKSWKNLEDRLYIVVVLGHGVVADVAAIATMDENHGLFQTTISSNQGSTSA